MPKKKHYSILHVLGGLNYGGAEQFVLNVLSEANSSGIPLNFDIMTRCVNDSSQSNLFAMLGGKIIETASFPKNFIKNYQDVSDYFRNNIHKYDVIHIHANALIYVFPIILGKKYGAKKIVLHSHNTSSVNANMNLLHYCNRFFLKYVDSCIACGHDAGRWMYGNRPYEVIYNGIDTKMYKYNESIRNSMRKKLCVENCFLIGHVGRFVQQKNHMRMLHIFKHVYKKNKKARMIMIGNGELKSLICDEACKEGLDKAIIFFEKRNDVFAILQACDMFLFPSLYEGLSIALIEAQISGLFCLVSDKIDKDSIISSNVKILGLNAPDEEWANAISDIMCKYSLCERDKAVFDNKFDVSNTLSNLLLLYERICNA